MVPEPTSSNEFESIFQEFTSLFIEAGMPPKYGIEQMAWLAVKSSTYKDKEIGLSADFYMKVILLKILPTDYDHETKQKITDSLNSTFQRMSDLPE